MSFKITKVTTKQLGYRLRTTKTKEAKIQEWVEETVELIKTTLEGEIIPIDLIKLPVQLKEKIKVHSRYILAETSSANNEPVNLNNVKGNLYHFSWSEKAPFPLIFKKYLEFLLISLDSIIEEAEERPVNIEEKISGGLKTGGTWAGTGWAYKGYIHQFEYKNQPPYSKEEEELLLLEQYDLERQKFERLKRKHKSGNVETESYKRERISEEVRIAVWRRDDGKCARCGSRENLEYDHIVPVSKGGGNTARNIELLCEKCNRSKSNNVA